MQQQPRDLAQLIETWLQAEVAAQRMLPGRDSG